MKKHKMTADEIDRLNRLAQQNLQRFEAELEQTPDGPVPAPHRPDHNPGKYELNLPDQDD